MRCFRFLAAACGVPLAILAVGGAQANDTTAALTTGGLVFGKTADIEMRAEDLSISEKRVVVRYRSFNRAKTDETVMVVFPTPDVDWTDAHPIAVPDDESDNFLDFHTTVDGRPVAMQIEQRAFVEGRDVTQALVSLGVPLMPTAKKTRTALDALPKPARRRFKKSFSSRNSAELSASVGGVRSEALRSCAVLRSDTSPFVGTVFRREVAVSCEPPADQ